MIGKRADLGRAGGRSPSVAVFQGAATIGRFRCAPSDPWFRDSGPARTHLLVFPREPVVIRHAGKAPVIADPGVVMIYNRGQAYTREALVPAGDRCDWFGFSARDVADACGIDDLDRPFGDRVRARCDPQTYLLARRAFEHAGRPDRDPAWLDEVAQTLLARATRAAPITAPSRAHVELAEAARASIGRTFAGPRSLVALARELGVSPFHLARTFRAVTGLTVHRLVTELRARAALEPIADGVPLATIAVDLGFSHHSHFTHAFRTVFGVPPRAVRARS